METKELRRAVGDTVADSVIEVVELLLKHKKTPDQIFAVIPILFPEIGPVPDTRWGMLPP